MGGLGRSWHGSELNSLTCAFINISPFSFFFPEGNFISVQILASQKGSKKQFHAAWFLWFVFELCLPFLSTFLIIAVFLELSSSSIPRYANLYHHCAMFLLSSFTSPLLCWDFQKASCSSVATLCPGPGSQERFFCLFALCPEEPCLFSYNTQAISRFYMCSFDFLDYSFSQDRFHSLHGVCSP